MLRKLFIGLLILSALTSRGTGNEICETSEGFSPESFLSLCGDKRLVEAENAEAREFAMPERIPVFMGNVIVPIEEFVRVKSLEQFIYGNAGGNFGYDNLEICSSCTPPVSYPYRESLISSGTDISPPAL